MHYAIHPDNVLHLNFSSRKCFSKTLVCPVFSIIHVRAPKLAREKVDIRRHMNSRSGTLDNGHPFTAVNCKTLENKEYNILQHHRRFYKVSGVQHGKIR